MRKVRISIAAILLTLPLGAATFGTVFSPPGGISYSDIVLDEGRSLLYLVNSNANRIDTFNTRTRTYGPTIATDLQPVSAALSRDRRFLYVTTYTTAVLDVIDLTLNQVTSRISLPANPEGIAVGADGRLLITAVNVNGGNANTLMIYDPAAGANSPLSNVPVVPPAATPPVLPTPSGRIYVSYRSRLTATPDGRFIIGVNGPNAANKVVFVYETASGTVLRSRTVTNLSTTISVSADGAKFMAGATLFDTATLQILAQQNTANAPFTFPAGAGTNFNLQQNQGGSVFSPDGSVLYAAFNIAPVGAARANITQLMLNDPDNLLINVGITMPENLAGKMIIDAAGANIYALSDSGVMLLPVSTITSLPIALPQSRSVLLTNDTCQVLRLTTATTNFDNGGRGRFTVTLGAQANGGAVIVGPGGQPIPVPGGPAIPAPTAQVVNTGQTPVVTFRYNNAAAANVGTVGPTDFIISSPEAINNPGVIHVYQNNRDSISQGNIVPVSINASTAEGLADILLDSARQRLYITNAGLNRLEVFDLRTRRFLNPIKVGQLPHGMAFGQDGNTLYVANTGGESISIVDLTRSVQTGRVTFPALPFNAAVPIAAPVAIASSGRGPQFIMSDGSFWKVTANQAIPRTLNPAVFPNNARGIPGGNPAQWTMASTPGGEFVFIFTGTGAGYLYDYTIDDIVVTKQVLAGAIVGYVGPVTAGPQGRYYTVGGTVLNASLTPVVGSTNGLSPNNRLVAAVSAVSANQLAMFTMPVRGNPNAVVPDAGLVELFDPTSGQPAGSAPTLEGPATVINGTARTNMFPRTMAIDATSGSAYVLTATGLSIVNLSPTAVNPALRPAINTGGLVNLGDFTGGIAAGGMFTVFGRNLGTDATAKPPLPTLLGGVCMTLNGTPIPMQMTSAGQINAQVPVTLAAGRYPLVIRSIDNQIASVAGNLTVARYAPAVLISTDKQPAILHKDGRYVTQAYPAKRDETLTIYATGMGPVKGATVATGAAAPADPVAQTDPVLVYFGSPSFKQSQMIVKSSNLVPGLVGIAQITITVPGFRQTGKSLPVSIKVGNVWSSTSGPAAPTVAVN